MSDPFRQVLVIVIEEVAKYNAGPKSNEFGHEYAPKSQALMCVLCSHAQIRHTSDVKGRRTSVKVVKSRPPGFSLTFRTCTFRLIAALTGPTIFSKREAPSVLRKKKLRMF